MDLNGETIKTFIQTSTVPKDSVLKGALSSPEMIGLTKFAIETCEKLSMSKITDIEWFTGECSGMVVSLTVFARPQY